MRRNRNNLKGGSDSQAMIWIGVGLIAAALLIFAMVFLFSKSDGDSSSKTDSSKASQSSSQSSLSSESTTTTQKRTEAASSSKTSETETSSQTEKPKDTAQMSVHFIDCGQGDATLIISGGKAMLVDCGEMDDSNKVINYIKEQGVKEFSCIIVTHPHTDHMGEMTDILKTFKTEKFIMPKVPDSMTPTIMRYEKMLKQVKAQGLEVTWSSDDKFTLGDAQVQTFTPKQEQEDLNNYSTLVRVSCGGRSVLITGDCETPEEKDIMSQGFDITADILKVAHHGSYKASSYEFLETVKPGYAVISCGENNDYGHPHEAALKRLKKKVKNIYITKDNGSVVFSINAGELTVTKQRG